MPLPLPFLPRQFPKPQGHLMVNRLSPRLFIALGTGLLRLHFITLWLTYEAKTNLCINKQSIISRLLTYCQDRKLPSHLTTNIFLLIDIGGPVCGPSTLSLSSVGSKINHSLHKMHSTHAPPLTERRSSTSHACSAESITLQHTYEMAGCPYGTIPLMLD